MRLKEDSSSYKSSNIKRRDFRHGSLDLDNFKFKPKKDTKKWCKGIIGRKHIYELQEIPWVARLTIKQLVCVLCDKRDWKTTIYPNSICHIEDEKVIIRDMNTQQGTTGEATSV